MNLDKQVCGRRLADEQAIGVVLVFAARDVFGRLMDRVDPDLLDSAVTVLAARPGVRAVRRVRMHWVGHQLEADAELDVDPSH